jgi:hypothetical protein
VKKAPRLGVRLVFCCKKEGSRSIGSLEMHVMQG